MQNYVFDNVDGEHFRSVHIHGERFVIFPFWIILDVEIISGAWALDGAGTQGT